MQGSSIDPSTSTEWVQVSGFPIYDINEDGLVKNEVTGRLLRWTMKNGVPCVQLNNGTRYQSKQVCTLMIESWLPAPEFDHFDTPTHLDGDRLNCRLDNLVLRPRWFAIAYHKEIHIDLFPRWGKTFVLEETGDVFYHPKDCAMKYGLLQKDIALALHHKGFVFPGGYTFSFV
jgi:hypothetical protein